MPAGVAEGDILVITVTTGGDGSSLLSTPGGLTTHQAFYEGEFSGFAGAVYTYVVPASPPADLQWGFSGNEDGTIAWLHIDNVAGGVDGFEINDEGYVDEFAVPAITTTQDDCLVVGGFMQGSGSSMGTPPSGWTTRVDGSNRNGFLATKDATQESPGSTGSATFDSSSSATGRAWQMAIALAGAAAPTPSLQHAIIGAPQPDGFTVNAKVSNATSARLVVAGDAGLSVDVAYSSPDTPDADGYVSLTISGLTTRARDYYALELTDSEAATSVTPLAGSPKRRPATDSPADFSVAFGSCWDNGLAGAPAFDMILGKDPDLFFHLGDWVYADSESTSQSSHRADMESQINASASLKELVANVPTVYVKSDHDGDANEQGPGPWTAPNRAATLQMFPYNTRPNANGLYHAFTVGRVRFIFIDTRYLGDNSTTRLGATQKAWLKTEMERSEPFKVLVEDGAWIHNEGAETPGEDDSWSTYGAERTELGNHWTANGVGQLVVMHGDQHAISADDGSNNPWGGFPSFCGAPFSNLSSIKTLSQDDWSEGYFPPVVGTPVEQYGLVEFTDTGDGIGAQFRGYDSSNDEQVSLLVATEGYEPPPPPLEPERITSTGATSLTSPSGRWVKAPTRPLWWDGVNEEWRGVLPTSSGHRLYSLVPGAITQGAVVDSRQSCRVTAVHDAGNTYVLRQHASSTLLSVYNSSWTATLTDASVPLTAADNDASPMALFCSSNGHLWAAVHEGGSVQVTRSTNGGSTWSAVTSWSLTGTGVPILVQTGSTLLLFVSANDGFGFLVRTISISAGSIASGSWAGEAAPSLPAGITSDDHASGVALADGRVVIVGKTTGATSSSQPLIFSAVRASTGSWTVNTIEPGPDSGVRYTRPSVTRDDGTLHVVYGSIGSPYELSGRTVPSDALAFWSTRETLNSDGDFLDGGVMPTPEDIDATTFMHWPTLAVDSATADIWVNWKLTPPAVSGVVPGTVGSEPISAIYLGDQQISGIYLGALQLM